MCFFGFYKQSELINKIYFWLNTQLYHHWHAPQTDNFKDDTVNLIINIAYSLASSNDSYTKEFIQSLVPLCFS